jgi:hypothetical protein
MINRWLADLCIADRSDRLTLVAASAARAKRQDQQQKCPERDQLATIGTYATGPEYE